MTARRWAEAWQDALYGPEGFYCRPEGPAGHFTTSAQGIPGVDEILAQALLALAAQWNVEVVLDFACGRGELLTTLSRYAPPELALIGCDVVERPANLPARITWVRSPGGPSVPSLSLLNGRRALVVAHEWLDVVPCDLIEIDDLGIPREVLVQPDGIEVLGGVREVPSGADLQPGTRIENSDTREAAWSRLVTEVQRHATPGSVVLGIDYAVRRATAPAAGTLTGFRDGSECLPVPDGSCDITSHVVLDGLDLSDEVRTQREVLLDLFGRDALAPVPRDLAVSDPPRYLERLAARSALAAACTRGGLGDFAWFIRRI